MNKERTAITPTRSENFPEWYQEVVRQGELAEHSSVRGCMVIKPWGYGLWEKIRDDLDLRIKATGHENAYFPLFIPLSLLQKEADHVEGFAKECAVVTHHRLEAKGGKLVPAGELEEPLVVRPTSETIIGESFSRWVQSYRDLPLLINQWANVVRWEMRTRLFLRTAEFLWQEGHTVHADADEAVAETLAMHRVYAAHMREVLGLAFIEGEKPAHERFPGAVNSYTSEAVMQDGKALQAATSHFLGQNFSKASDIRFLDRDGERKYAFTTSWGSSTRLVGGVIMTHADDDGLRLPPRIAPKHAVVLPVTPDQATEDAVREAAGKAAAALRGALYAGRPVDVTVDHRDVRGGEKNWQWVKKGVPVRVEIGPRDVAKGEVVVYRRDRPVREKLVMPLDRLASEIPRILDEMQTGYLREAEERRDRLTERGVKDTGGLRDYFGESKGERGFVIGKWCGDGDGADVLAELKISVRCIPFEQSGSDGRCLLTGKPATTDVVYGRSY